ncbi:lipoprotein-anchoring transpeptidase ErfK/SrfK [Mycoplana sp. BE70]|uniref:L,D-transpeptidase n=1 Tax=Mycoplana sp. BE70 TaxID=2817775 RepID=UPI00285CD4C7|nr:L,D-transpeptidase [Mycoplana sp. BE70]MDR6759179.1 lipoprotein-anchoring transpeptidase ErfK/SrfK [Mycoplana sp. BE70]
MKAPVFPASATRLRGILLATLAAGLLSACAQTAPSSKEIAKPRADPNVQSMYAAVQDGDTVVPAVDVSKMDPQNIRQVVDYRTKYPPGTIVVDPHARFLYLVMEGGKAMRYGVGVAKAGLEFEGEADIARKGRWPGWVPTPNMIARNPERYGPLAGGMEGGLRNPLGARALYLYKNGQDTLYRIHGTNEPWSIGKSVSSGCIRLLNQDIIDLHRRVPKGSRVVVLGPNQSAQGEI